MTHTTGFSALPAAVLALPAAFALWASPAHAADEDTQLWLYFNGVVPLDDDATMTIEISPRWREEDADLLQTRATIDVDLSPSVTIGAGAAYIESAGGSEYRPHQQFSFNAGPISFRTRLEQRFFDDAPRPQIRLRQRVGTSIEVGPRTKLTGSVEYLHNVRPERRGEEARIDSWRGLIGVQQELSSDFTLEVNYHVILSPREDAPDKLSHIPRMTLTRRF
jgi:hypothetical protein